MSMERGLLTAEELRELASGDEAKVIELCRLEHERASLQHPEFAELVHDLDPLVCRRLDLVELLRRAPNGYVRQYLLATWDDRQAINLVSGRSFT